VIFFIHWILWSESSAGQLFFLHPTTILNYILWDDCGKNKKIA
jgi:hypothetical protein